MSLDVIYFCSEQNNKYQPSTLNGFILSAFHFETATAWTVGEMDLVAQCFKKHVEAANRGLTLS
jgi:hypothetical protein